MLRDLLMLALVVVPSIAALRRPWIGAMVWTWLSLMVPHQQWAYAAANWPLAAIAGGATLIGIFTTRERQWPFFSASLRALLAFVVWICITLPASMFFESSYDLWLRSMKIFFMLFVTVALITDRFKLEVFIWVCAFSIGFYGFKGGLFTLATAGSYRVWGPGGFIGGNNEIAAALVMTIPLVRYLHLQATNPWMKRGMLVWMLLMAVTALGSYSRGALLAIGAMSVFLWLKSDKKFIGAVVVTVSAVMMLSFMPEQWWGRMNTIDNYQEDGSAMGRINAWIMAWNLAKEHFLGGGFMIYRPETFLKYAPDPNDIHAAHSIYFQILGEHGFVGLGLFLLIGVFTWMDARRLSRAFPSDHPEHWAGDLGRMIQVSMVGFAVGGAFLSLAYFDLPYNMMAMAAIAVRLTASQRLGGVGALPSAAKGLAT